MSNALDQVAGTATRHAPPPIGPDGIQRTLERRTPASTTRWVRTGGRQARAEVLAAGLRWTSAALLRALGAVRNFVRCGGYGIAKRVPERSTTPCR